MKSHNLIVMRHAKSSWGVHHKLDYKRPLAKRGRRDALMMANWLAEQSFRPVAIRSSPAERARETSEIVASVLRITEIEWDDGLYMGDVTTLLESATRPLAQDWLLVGHNPGLEWMLDYLCPGCRRLSTYRKLNPTAAIHALRLPVRDTGKLKRGDGYLLMAERPKNLLKI